MEPSETEATNFLKRANDVIEAHHLVERLRLELLQSEDNCRRSAKEGLVLIDRNVQLTSDLDNLRASLEKIQGEKLHVEQLLKQALQSQRILSDIGDEQEENLLEAASHTAESLRQQLTTLNNDSRRLQADYARAVEQMKEVEHDYAVLFDEHDALKRKHTGARDELRDFKKSEQRMQDENADLQGENVALQSQLAGLRQRQVEFESMKLEVKQLLDEKDVLDADLSEMQKLYEMLQVQNADLVKSLENERELRQALKRELDARELEEQARASMEALTLQHGVSTNGFVAQTSNNRSASPVEDTSEPVSAEDAANSSRLSLFDELQQHWPQQAADAEKAELQLAQLVTDLRIAREQLDKSKHSLEMLVNSSTTSLSHMRQLADVHAKPLLKAAEHASAVPDVAQQVNIEQAAIFHDFQNIIDSVLKEIFSVAAEAGVVSVDAASTLENNKFKTDLESLRLYKLKSENLLSKCAKLEADAEAVCADVSTIFGLLIGKQNVISGAGIKCNKTLARFRVDAVTDLSPSVSAESAATRFIPVLKSEIAIKNCHIGGDAAEDSDAVSLHRTQDELDEQVAKKFVLLKAVVESGEAVEPTDTVPESAVLKVVSLHQSEELSKQLDEAHNENAGLRALLATQREQIHSLRDSLKNTTQTAEHSLVNLKAKYDSDKLQARENLVKMRHELNQRKEDATTFASIRSMLTARCSDYVTQIENLQRKLKTSEQEKQTLSGLVHLAIRQKLTLIERIQELESHLDAVNLNQANDADAAHGGSGSGWRVRKTPGADGGSSSRRDSNNNNNYYGGSNGTSGRSSGSTNANSNAYGTSSSQQTRRNGAGTYNVSPQQNTTQSSGSSSGSRAAKRHH